MQRSEAKLYQDQLYGAKVLSPLAVAIMNTPEFQRLAGLKQLGFSDVIYRGAHHTRFEHSVGTYFVCRSMMRRIVQNHERLGLKHPATLTPKLSVRFTHNPDQADLPEEHTSAQAVWRGLTEVVSIAGLIHDLGHVPFGHTLEDEFSGIYVRHDGLGHVRVHSLIFHEQSHLARVFSDDRHEPWVKGLSNAKLQRLLYLILSWKEEISPPLSFEGVIKKELKDPKLSPERKSRLLSLEESFHEMTAENLYQPYMSDIVGNTICADLLDYLPRDRMNLGMQYQMHHRLQRYLTIRNGTYRSDEGLRLSIMVTRQKHGGQRKDIATSILSVVRERYEMAERVYYHHKKAAASAMLVSLLELLPRDQRPRDDEEIYPAPWSDTAIDASRPPHLIHLSDAEFISYVGSARLEDAKVRPIQKHLHGAIKYRRDDYYRTLVVLDVPIVRMSTHTPEYIATELRNPEGFEEASTKRHDLERHLAHAADAEPGEVIIYCPSQKMQSKEVDARVEIRPGKVVPLRVQQEEFAYYNDLQVLDQYYKELWRVFVFVSPRIFADPQKSKAISDALCKHYSIDEADIYRNVRTHEFKPLSTGVHSLPLEAMASFFGNNRLSEIPQTIVHRTITQAATDVVLSELTIAGDGGDQMQRRIEQLFNVVLLDGIIANDNLTGRSRARALRSRDEYMAGTEQLALTARAGAQTYEEYVEFLRSKVGANPRKSAATDEEHKDS